MLLKYLSPLFFTTYSYASSPNYAAGHSGIIHLFEWHWDTIADECERFLGPKKVGGIQISPPHENRVIYNNGDRPWWERYQPISYKFETRSGDEKALKNMIKRCNAVGVRIYPDVVINHMCGGGGTGTGTGGTYFDANSESFPGVPYSSLDFNDGNCNSGSGNIENYQDTNQVRNCRLVNLIDLNQSKTYVREKIADMMNSLISFGVAGFRVDACKHMWPGDLEVIFNDLLSNVNADLGGGKPYIFQEVIDQGGEPITASQYFGAGSVTEFKYGIQVANNIQQIHYLGTLGESWGLMPDQYALAFLSNHDNQRGHGGGGSLITFENPYDYKVGTAFMMAWPYGVKRVMSSYYFSNTDQGPPANQRGIASDYAESCTNGWVCEHRWKAIAASFRFAGAVEGTSMNNWWDNGNNAIAFSRGNKGFIAINKSSGTITNALKTGLPAGSYKDLVSGASYSVGSDGKVSISLSNNDDKNIIMLVNDDGGDDPTPPGPSPTDGTCDVSAKIDCGFLGIDQSGCEAKGCCWKEVNVSGEPWCYYPEN